MRRALAPIIAAKWTIMYRSEPGDIITSELGYANSKDTIDSIPTGWTIPLMQDTVLKLTPCPDGYQRKVLFYSTAGEWRALIKREPLRIAKPPQPEHVHRTFRKRFHYRSDRSSCRVLPRGFSKSSSPRNNHSIGWYIVPIVPVNLPQFRTGLRLRGRSIDLSMTEVPGFTDYTPAHSHGKSRNKR